MTAPRTPNFALKREFEFKQPDRGDIMRLPAGSFVRPINSDYVPKHCLETVYGKFFDPRTEVFAYTRYGILVIPKEYLMEV